MSTIVRRRGNGRYGIPDGEHELKALLDEANGIFIKRGFCASNEDVLRLVDNTIGEEFLNAVRDDVIHTFLGRCRITIIRILRCV